TSFEDVGQLLVVMRVLRHDRALREIHVGDHHLRPGDEAPPDQRIELLAGQVVPAVVRRPISHDGEIMDRWATFDCYGTLIDWNRGVVPRGAHHVARAARRARRAAASGRRARRARTLAAELAAVSRGARGARG